MTNKYSILHCHTELSSGTTNIDSVTKYEQYIERASHKEDGIYNITFTEHGNIFNWYKKKLALEKAGFKYIHGLEAYITETLDEKVRDNYHCILLAKNYEGFKELNRLVSTSYNRADVTCYGKDEHYYYTPRITYDELINTSENIIILTACLAGILSKGNVELKKKFLKFIIHNKNRCYLEVQHHQCKEQVDYNKWLTRIARKYDLQLVACTDTHSLNEQHAKGREILQKAKGISFENEAEWDLVYKTYDELIDAFKKQGALSESECMMAIENTNKIVDSIEEFTLDTNTKYPHIYDNPLETFKQKINKAYSKHPYLKKRYSKEKIKEVINNELEVYQKTQSIDFMLLQTYLREWEESQGIQCGYGRGSVSGSEIAYTLGITQMDSIKFGLNFFRFMNPSRVTNADIDTDYSSVDRDKVKYFLLHDHMNLPKIQSAEIITFNTIALKGAIRDVGRALNIPLKDVNDICNRIEKEEDKLRKQYPKLFEYVDIVNGTVVSIGTHPSGVLVSDRNLFEEIGLCSLSTSKYPVSMLNMKELDALMYVKLDILGLDNIGIINESCKLLGIERLTPDNVNLEDEKVWKSIRDNTTLIFQWESDSAQTYLKKFMSDKTLKIAKTHNPDFSYIKWFSFGNGLIRPGCASFRDDIANGDILTTGFKEYDEWLAITFGRITMQEDIMQFLVKFCGYSDAESDTVRRGIAKKYGTEQFIDEIHNRFISYSHNKYNQPINERLEVMFPGIEQGILDASKYAFSWNHSDSYSCVGYICGYLRYYHPLEFLTASLNVFQDKEDKTLAITEYAKQVGINISLIKFGKSQATYSCDKKTNTIYKGIASIKFLNNKIADELYELRHNKYLSFIELLIDIKEKTCVNSKQLDILIKLDFFSQFGEINQLLKQVEIFDLIYNRKQFRIEEIKELSLPMKSFEKYADSITEKTIKIFDSVELIKDICSTLSYPKTTIIQKISYQQEFLGYIQITIPDIKPSYAFVQKIDGQQTRRVSLYRLNDGSVELLKVRGKAFSNNPFNENDIIKTVDCYEEKKWKYDKENGSYYQIDEKEMILSKWSIVEDD